MTDGAADGKISCLPSRTLQWSLCYRRPALATGTIFIVHQVTQCGSPTISDTTLHAAIARQGVEGVGRTHRFHNHGQRTRSRTIGLPSGSRLVDKPSAPSGASRG